MNDSRNSCGETYVLEIPVPAVKPEEIVIEAEIYSLRVATEPRGKESISVRKYDHRLVQSWWSRRKVIPLSQST